VHRGRGTRAPVKDRVGETGGVRGKLTGDPFSPPFSNARVCGYEKWIIDLGLEYLGLEMV